MKHHPTSRHIRRAAFAFLALLFLLAAACQRRQPSQPHTLKLVESVKPPPVAPIDRDLNAIKERGTLVVLAPYNSTTYFLYRGEPLGYEFELLGIFAEEHGLKLEMQVVTNPNLLFNKLNTGEGDIVAARLNPKPEDEVEVAFTNALYRTEPSLVQQKAPPDKAKLTEPAKTEIKAEPSAPQAGDSVMSKADDAMMINARLIERPAQLAGEKVTLPEGSAYKRTLIELSDEITGEISVVEIGGNADEEALVAKVAKGDVEYTVVQDNLAELKEAHYTNIKIRPIVGASHKVSWAVRKNASVLQNELNRWIAEKKNGSLFDRMYKKYFTDRKSYKERVESEYLTSMTGKLSQYDPLLKRYAPELNWDWRLLAAQTFQESRFKPDARSWAGASGLLQLMPATAREYGVKNSQDPEDNVRGAVKFLIWLTRYWRKIPDEAERLKFILASYNCGAGHVEDAQRLTVKYGGNPESWNDVSYWLLQLSKSQYSTDPVVKYGFCRGIEPVTYVIRILERFNHYKQFVVTT